MFFCSQKSKCSLSALLATGCLIVLGVLLAIVVIEKLKNEDQINEALSPHHTPTCCNRTAPNEQSRWANFLFSYFHFLLPSVLLEFREIKIPTSLCLYFADYMGTLTADLWIQFLFLEKRNLLVWISQVKSRRSSRCLYLLESSFLWHIHVTDISGQLKYHD